MSIRFREDHPADGPTNMARDVELLDAAELGQAGCRVYEWTGPWLTLGRFQNPDTDLLDKDLVPYVIRPTGGKAVLHGHDITVGIAAPLDVLGADGGPRSLKRLYRLITKPLIAALNECHLPSVLAEDTPFVSRGPASANCFVSNSPNDIVNPLGRKVCGCALKFTRRAVLLQASIPYTEPLVDTRHLFNTPTAESEFRWDSMSFFPELPIQLEKVFGEVVEVEGYRETSR